MIMWKKKIIQALLVVALGVLVSPLKATEPMGQERQEIGKMTVRDLNSKDTNEFTVYKGETWKELKSEILDKLNFKTGKLVFEGREVDGDVVIPYDKNNANVHFLPGEKKD